MTFWVRDKKIVGLAPMDGITDSPFRCLAKSFGADVVFTEMISADGLLRKSKSIFNKLRFKRRERPIIAQIFGKEPKILGEAAEILERDFKFDGIDINAACPKRNVLKSGHGGALIKNPRLLFSIVNVVRHKIKVPLSVKTRIGFGNPSEVFKIAKGLEACGIDCLIVHGRTVKQNFSGKANWEIFSKIKSKIKIPLIASGDIFSKSDLARLFLTTNVDGALVARGALGNPWIFEGLEIIKNNPKMYLLKKDFAFENISTRERKEVILEHFELMREFYKEEKTTAILFRKFFLWYLRGLNYSKKIKSKAAKISNLKDIKEVLDEIKE